MKKIISLTLGLFIATTMLAQLPNNVTVKDLDGKNVSVADISNNGKPIIISFWLPGVSLAWKN